MAFFGFKPNDLQQEKLDFKKSQSGDVAVYTWGEEGYDGLGNLLQEGGDELNDETFGGIGSVGEQVLFGLEGDQLKVSLGKDFDFSSPALPHHTRPSKDMGQLIQESTHQAKIPPSQSRTILPTCGSPVLLLTLYFVISSTSFQLLGSDMGRQITVFCPSSHQWRGPLRGSSRFAVVIEVISICWKSIPHSRPTVKHLCHYHYPSWRSDSTRN